MSPHPTDPDYDPDPADTAMQQAEERAERDLDRVTRLTENYPDIWRYNDGRGL